MLDCTHKASSEHRSHTMNAQTLANIARTNEALARESVAQF